MTFDLPPALVKQVKLQAVHEGKKLKETVANLLLRGMAASGDVDVTAGVSKPSRSSLPVVKCSHTARPESAMTPERIAEILHGQEVERHGAGR